MDSLGSRLKHARKLRKITQDDLAIAIGVKMQSISRFERGEMKPSSDNLVRLAGALGVTERWLAQGTGEMEQQPAPEPTGEPSGPENGADPDESARTALRALWEQERLTYDEYRFLERELEDRGLYSSADIDGEVNMLRAALRGYRRGGGGQHPVG